MDKKDQWLPESPDRNPLDYCFWNKIKTKVYGDRLNTHFTSEEKRLFQKQSWFGKNAPQN